MDSITISSAEARDLVRYAEVGEVVLNWMRVTVQLGHDNPAMSLEYMNHDEGTTQAFVADFIAWTSGRKSLAPGCEERLRAFTERELALSVRAQTADPLESAFAAISA